MKDLSNLPLTKNQRRLWISYLQDKQNPAYNLKLTYHLPGDLNIEIFNRSMALLFQQQHSVFSVFKQVDGLPHVEIHPFDIHIEYIDMSDGGAEKARTRIYEFVAEDSRKTFDIETGPMFRLYLLKAGEKDHFFHGTIHHIVFDGFSRRIFIQELSKIYNSILAGKAEDVELNVSQSYDFAAWETQLAVDQNEDEMIKFWKENLNDCPAELKFPYDRTRKSIPSGFGYRESFSVPKDVSLKLKQLSQESGTSLFETVLSSVGLLFNKYTGENDICIGIPVSTRLRNPKLWKIFGYFVNTGVVRIKIDEEKGFRDIVKFTGKAAKDAVTNSNLAFEKIVDAVKPPRIPGLNPLFQVSLSWFTNFTVPMELGEIKGERINVSEGVSPFDITFLIWENEGVVQGEIEYSIELLDHETIVRFKENFITLLGLLVREPDSPVSGLSLLSENELKHIESINNTEAPVPDLLLHELFMRQQQATPDKVAVRSGAVAYTFSDLESRSNKLANYLISRGVRPGDRIGLSLERSCEMTVSVLAILKTGSCYVPLDPYLPNDRLSYMLEDSGAKFLLSQHSLSDKFPDFDPGATIHIDTLQNEIAGQAASKPQAEFDNQNLTYIIYTSGSTGRPKGVKVHHQAVVNFILSMQTLPGLTSADRLLAVTTLSFDISVLEMFLPLSVGAETIIAKGEQLTNGQQLAALLEEYDITLLQATPVTWTLLVSSGWNGKKNLKSITGGEPLSPGLAKDLFPRVKELWNLYGPTETTVWSTAYRITDPAAQILVGKPINNTQIYIVDKYNKMLPVGCIGEVCIGGKGVTKGYNNRPELTEEKFIPFREGVKVYKTGDLGRIQNNGNIELFGRMDNQLKVRGFRIEAGEIESLLLNIAGIREAVVKAHEFSAGDQRLVAFLNIEPGFSMANEEITKILGKILPVYMIPSFYQKMEGFPRMPNGKINRKALVLDLGGESQQSDDTPVELNPTQEKIMKIFEDVLKFRNIKLTDNFFDVGGNSLLAISVFSKVEAAFSIQLSLRTFFDGPRVKDLAEVVDYTIYKATNRKIETDTKSATIKGEI